MPSQPQPGGYQLPLAMDIFRGRYRNSLEYPEPVALNPAPRYFGARDAVVSRLYRLLQQPPSAPLALLDRMQHTPRLSAYWQVSPAVKLSLDADNLFDRRHCASSCNGLCIMRGTCRGATLSPHVKY